MINDQGLDVLLATGRYPKKWKRTKSGNLLAFLVNSINVARRCVVYWTPRGYTYFTESAGYKPNYSGLYFERERDAVEAVYEFLSTEN